MDLKLEWLGRMPYREAWARQRHTVEARNLGAVPDTLLLVEHEPVLTLGRHAADEHVLAGPVELARRGIEVIRVERGGEVTYHGPGQLVAYPIIRLRDRGILLRPFVRALEGAMADTAAGYGVTAAPRAGHPGVWVEPEADAPRKLGALGLRVERGITFHGIALNITTRLADFGLIDPCGMSGLDVTSIARELGWRGEAAEPSTEAVRAAGERFAEALSGRLADAVNEAAERAQERGGVAERAHERGGVVPAASVASPDVATPVASADVATPVTSAATAGPSEDPLPTSSRAA